MVWYVSEFIEVRGKKKKRKTLSMNAFTMSDYVLC